LFEPKIQTLHYLFNYNIYEGNLRVVINFSGTFIL